MAATREREELQVSFAMDSVRIGKTFEEEILQSLGKLFFVVHPQKIAVAVVGLARKLRHLTGPKLPTPNS